MKPVVLLDTGPLVAYLSERDADHAWAVSQFQHLAPPLVTCEPVLTEAFFLVRSVFGRTEALIDLLGRNSIVVSFALMEHFSSVFRLMHRYSDQPMSLADACLVRMAELNPSAKVATLDRRFKVYRKNGRQAIPTLMPTQE